MVHARSVAAPPGPAPELPVSRLPWRLPVLELPPFVISIRDPGGPAFPLKLCFLSGIREYSGLRSSADAPALPGKSTLFAADPLFPSFPFSFQNFSADKQATDVLPDGFAIKVRTFVSSTGVFEVRGHVASLTSCLCFLFL